MKGLNIYIIAAVVFLLSVVSCGAQDTSPLLLFSEFTKDTTFKIYYPPQEISLIVSSSKYGSEISTQWMPEPERFNIDSPITYYVNLWKIKPNDTLLIIIENDTLVWGNGGNFRNSKSSHN